jgi:hypothetical protein
MRMEEAAMDPTNAGSATGGGTREPNRSDPSESAFDIRSGDGPSAAQRGRELATAGPPGHTGESGSAVLDKGLHRSLPSLTEDELRRLSVLEPGTALDQGGVYLDLNHLDAGPVTAFGEQIATPDNRFVSKKETDYELWNRLTGRDTDGDGVPDPGA